MTTEFKARQFWLDMQDDPYSEDEIWTYKPGHRNDLIHVVEKSYADKLQVELAKKDELLRECEKALEHYANKRISEGGTARAYFEKWKKDAKT